MTTLFIFVVYIFKLYKNLGAEYEKFLKDELHRVQEQNTELIRNLTHPEQEALTRYNREEEETPVEPEEDSDEEESVQECEEKPVEPEEDSDEEEESVEKPVEPEEDSDEEEESVQECEEKPVEPEEVSEEKSVKPEESDEEEESDKEKKREKKSIELWAIDEELVKFTGWQPNSLVTFKDVFDFTNEFIKTHDMIKGLYIVPSRNNNFKDFIGMSQPFKIPLLPVYLRMHLNPVPKCRLIGIFIDNLVFKPGHMDVVVGRRINGKIMPLTVQEQNACRKLGCTVV